MKKYISKIWELYKPFKRIIFLLIFFTLLKEILILFPPVLYAKIVDSVIYKDSIYRSLNLVAIMFGLSFFNSVILGYIVVTF